MNQYDGRSTGRASQIAQAYRSAHEVVSAALSLALMVGAGYWLDERLGWRPVLTICGACLGFVMAGFSLRRLLRRLDQETEKRKRRAAENRGTSQK